MWAWGDGVGLEMANVFCGENKSDSFLFVYLLFSTDKPRQPAATIFKIFFFSPKTGPGLENKQPAPKVNLKDAHGPLFKPEMNSTSLVWK